MDPEEIRLKEFNRRFRGYDIQDVRLFMDQVADYLEAWDSERDF